MTVRIWDGRGEADGMVTFVDRRGVVRGRPHVRALARRYLRRSFIFTPAEIGNVLARTIDRDEWLSTFNGQLPGSVARSVVDAVRTGGVDFMPAPKTATGLEREDADRVLDLFRYGTDIRAVAEARAEILRRLGRAR